MPKEYYALYLCSEGLIPKSTLQLRNLLANRVLIEISYTQVNLTTKKCTSVFK